MGANQKINSLKKPATIFLDDDGAARLGPNKIEPKHCYGI